MDGEVNNRTVRIAHNTDETQEMDALDGRIGWTHWMDRRDADETRRDAGDRQTRRTDAGDGQTHNTTHLKELGD